MWSRGSRIFSLAFTTVPRIRKMKQNLHLLSQERLAKERASNVLEVDVIEQPKPKEGPPPASEHRVLVVAQRLEGMLIIRIDVFPPGNQLLPIRNDDIEIMALGQQVPRNGLVFRKMLQDIGGNNDICKGNNGMIALKERRQSPVLHPTFCDCLGR